MDCNKQEGCRGGAKAPGMLSAMHCWLKQELRMLRLGKTRNGKTPARKSHSVLPLMIMLLMIFILSQGKEYVFLLDIPLENYLRILTLKVPFEMD